MTVKVFDVIGKTIWLLEQYNKNLMVCYKQFETLKYSHYFLSYSTTSTYTTNIEEKENSPTLLISELIYKIQM